MRKEIVFAINVSVTATPCAEVRAMGEPIPSTTATTATDRLRLIAGAAVRE